MSLQRPQLINNEIYHIVLRGVGDSEIFKNTDDYYRGVFSIYEFNNIAPVSVWLRRKQRKQEKVEEKTIQALRCRTPQRLDKRDKLVEVLVFSLMPNHIHLLLRQVKDNGISQFMKKVGGGYANYFNQKYNRKGHLFNKFRAVLIETNEQLQNVFVYIHTNRISIIEPGWKENGIKNSRRVIKFLENDKWHSYPDYLGKKNFPSVTDRNFMINIMDKGDGCRKFVNSWVQYKKDMRNLPGIDLE